MADDVALDLGAQRAGSHREGHVHHDVCARDGHVSDHAEVDDAVAQLGVDHGPQAFEHL